MRAYIVVPLTAIVLVALAGAARAERGFDGRLRYRVATEGAPSLGPADAPITIVVFSDFLCPPCARTSDTLADVRLIYGERVRVVHRTSLLDEVDGTLAAEGALAAAAQGRFWPFHDRLFRREHRGQAAVLLEVADEIGLDRARFRRELERGSHRAELGRELAVAAALGVSTLPMAFVNGVPLEGNQPLGVYARVIDAELARLAAGVGASVRPAELPSAAELAPDAEPIGPRALDREATHAVGLGLPAQRQGDDDALVTIVEFADHRCGFCARAEGVVADLERTYGRDLRVVMRAFPVVGGPPAELAAEAALAAAEQGGFRRFRTAAFAAASLDRPALDAIGRALGLDARFGRALDERRYRRAVLLDRAEASRLGVRGTPTFFVNGRVLVGAQPREAFVALIDAELARARAELAAGTPRAELYRKLTGAR
jgi:protein-disulfide isomerase